MKLRGLILFLSLLSTSLADASAGRSVDEVVQRYAKEVKLRLKPHFDFAGVTWPPREIALVAIKEEHRMELWVKSSQSRWQHVRDYRVKGMSGTLGPKLREGDRQVPEGFYHIVRMNPNSGFHLSMKIDYPNAFDREQARLENRNQLGGEIYIHGADVSRGCLALGDTAIEEVFVLAAITGQDKVSVLIAPKDFRLRPVEAKAGEPAWQARLRRTIADGLRVFNRNAIH